MAKKFLTLALMFGLTSCAYGEYGEEIETPEGSEQIEAAPTEKVLYTTPKTKTYKKVISNPTGDAYND